MKKKILTALISLLMIFTIIPTSIFATTQNRKISESELEKAIVSCFNWAKKGNNILLNNEFLKCVGTTDGDWFPINMGIYGYEENTFNLYLEAIEKDITQKYQNSSKLDRNKATEWHRIALAVTAMGGDPTKIGKDANGKPINLIADGTYNCVLSSVTRQGINGAIWALIALDSMKYDVPSNAKYQREDLIALILERQMSDGGFSLGGSATRDLPSDPDVTGMALQALAPYKDSTKKYIAHGGVQKTVGQVINESLNQMSKLQKQDGDFDSWGTANVESVAQMLIGLTSLGIDPYEDIRFIKNGNTLIDGILKYQLPSGGFTHSFVSDPSNPSATAGEENRMASEQAELGLISYYRFINGMNSLYDFTKEDDTPSKPNPPQDIEIIKDIPWIVLEEVRLSGLGNEKFVAVFDENTNTYTINVPYGFVDIKVVETPFNSSVETNLKVGTVVNCLSNNTFYYINNKNEKINFTINCTYHYYSEPESIILETRYLANYNIDTETKKTIEKKVIDLENRFENLEFSYEKCYITAQIDFEKEIKSIKEKLKNVIDKDDNTTSDNTSSDNTTSDNTSSDNTTSDNTTSDNTTSDNTASDNTASDNTSSDNTTSDNTASDNTSGNNANGSGGGNNSGSNGHYEYENHYTTIVTTKTFDGFIPKGEFEAIQGIDENVKGIGTIGNSDKKCTFIFNGLDVVNPMDFMLHINDTCEYTDDILKLSPEAYILSFEHKDELPGIALLGIETDLEDGKYILFKYNAVKKQAEVVEKIEVLNGETQFIVDENSTYFIAKEASLESLLSEKEEQDDNSVIVKKETKTKVNVFMLILGILFILLALALIIALVLYLVKKKKKQSNNEKVKSIKEEKVFEESLF